MFSELRSPLAIASAEANIAKGPQSGSLTRWGVYTRRRHPTSRQHLKRIYGHGRVIARRDWSAEEADDPLYADRRNLSLLGTVRAL